MIIFRLTNEVDPYECKNSGVIQLIDIFSQLMFYKDKVLTLFILFIKKYFCL